MTLGISAATHGEQHNSRRRIRFNHRDVKRFCAILERKSSHSKMLALYARHALGNTQLSSLKLPIERWT